MKTETSICRTRKAGVGHGVSARVRRTGVAALLPIAAAVIIPLQCVSPVAAQRYDFPRPTDPAKPEPGRNNLWSRQAIQYDRAFSRILNAAEELGEKHAGEAWQTELKQVSTDAFFLQQRWREWLTYHEERYRRSGLADRYYQGLVNDAELLERARKEEDADKALSLVRDAAMDLNAKAENCRNSDDGLGKVVSVRVRTLAGTNEVSGYEVWFVQKGMLNVKAEHDRFYKLSSPTDSLDLPPGGYALWLVKGGASMNPVSQRIGGKGRKEIEIELTVSEP